MAVLAVAACVAAGVFVLVLLSSGIRLLIADARGSLCAGSFLSLTGSCTGGASSHICGAPDGAGAPPPPLAPENAPWVDDSSSRSAP